MQKSTRTLRVERIIKSSLERTFQAFIASDDVSFWMNVNSRSDLRVGGSYSSSAGDRGTILTLERPHLLEFTWQNERRCPGTIVRVRFTQIDDVSVRIVLEHNLIKSEQDEAGMREVWNWALDSFKCFLETGRNIKFHEWKRIRHD